MTDDDSDKKAQRHADLVAPKPTTDKTEAGLRGAAICGCAAMAFALLAGLDVEDFPGALALTALAGFAAPYLHFRHKEHLHAKAYVAEFTRLVPLGAGNAGETQAQRSSSRSAS